MSAMEAEVSPLFALLARHWRLGGVEASAFDASGMSVGFALGDGTLALASMGDEENANVRWRVSIENGRATVSTRSRPVPPPAIVPIDVAPIRLAPFGDAGFLVGGASGRLVTVAPDGAVRSLVDMDSGPVEAICATSRQVAFVAAGGLVARYGAGDATARAIARYEEPLRAMAPSTRRPPHCARFRWTHRSGAGRRRWCRAPRLRSRGVAGAGVVTGRPHPRCRP